jgi:glycosyltransferase involved in cell wall biosynthesis
LHIVHVAAFPGLGGVERRLIEYVSEVDDGNKHTLVAMDPTQDAEQMIVGAGVSYVVIRRMLRFDPIFPIKLAVLLRRLKPDIVYCRGFTSSLWVSLGPRMFGSARWIRSEHGSLLQHETIHILLERYINWRFEKVITVSFAMASEISARLNIPKENIEVVRYGLPIGHGTGSYEKDEINQESSEQLVVGSVTNFHPWKNVMSLIEAAPAILERYPNCKFVLVGGPVGQDYLDQCKARTRQLGIEDYFEFTGSLQDIRSVLASFDIFVLSSVFETFGAVVAEAMLAGVPVVAPNYGAVPELIEHGVNGVLVESTVVYSGGDMTTAVSPITGRLEPVLAVEPEELTTGVLSMLDNLEEWTERAKTTQEKATKQFSFGRYQSTMAALYERIIE